MKIAGTSLPSAVASAGHAEPTPGAIGAAAPAAAKPRAEQGALQSAALQPTVEALRALPDFDHAKVAELRAALAKGEVTFDAARLAGLIQRFHGGER